MITGTCDCAMLAGSRPRSWAGTVVVCVVAIVMAHSLPATGSCPVLLAGAVGLQPGQPVWPFGGDYLLVLFPSS
jgi:hypothetical protein